MVIILLNYRIWKKIVPCFFQGPTPARKDAAPVDMDLATASFAKLWPQPCSRDHFMLSWTFYQHNRPVLNAMIMVTKWNYVILFISYGSSGLCMLCKRDINRIVRNDVYTSVVS